MNPESRIYVAGHTGLVGSALMRKLKADGYRKLLVRTHAELDLTDQQAVQSFFQHERPEYVFIAAAKVGGIHANNVWPAEFIAQNLAIQTHLIHEAWRSGVHRLLFLGSSCIYPRACPQPMQEDHLLSGPLEATNRPYAIAKISGIEMCWAYNRQYGTQFLSAMPTNLYGPGDNYDLEASHVIPAMMRKFHLAKLAAAGDWRGVEQDEAARGAIPADLKAHLATLLRDPGAARVVLWGTGRPRREFLHSDDLASACLHLMNLPDERYQPLLAADRNDGTPPIVNIGCGADTTLADLAETVRQVVGFCGALEFDHLHPDGTPRKLLDTRRLSALGWKPRIELKEGLEQVYAECVNGGIRH